MKLFRTRKEWLAEETEDLLSTMYSMLRSNYESNCQQTNLIESLKVSNTKLTASLQDWSTEKWDLKEQIKDSNAKKKEFVE